MRAILILLALALLPACPPQRRAGGGSGDDDTTDDDDASADDDDSVDDDDSMDDDDSVDDDDSTPLPSGEGTVRLQSAPSDGLELPGALVVLRHPPLGMSAVLMASEDFSCEAFQQIYGPVTTEAADAFLAGELEVDEYTEILGNAVLDTLGRSRWFVFLALAIEPDADAPLALAAGPLASPEAGAFGVTSTTADPSTGFLDQGINWSAGDDDWAGLLGNTEPWVGEFDFSGVWSGGEFEGQIVPVAGSFDVPLCAWDSRAD